ncbi:MAG: hypothetical protein ABII85_00015 [Bacillota bacterium]
MKRRIKNSFVIQPDLMFTLSEMVTNREIPSIENGINSAVESYIKNRSRSQSRHMMEESESDEVSIQKTLNDEKSYLHQGNKK